MSNMQIPTFKTSALRVILWISLAMGFNLLVYFYKGEDRAIEFLTAYILELSLSVDNLFVFLIIFQFFGVDPKYQTRVLFWGILGAIILRGMMIIGGVSLVQHFAALMYLFGLVLIYTGSKLFFSKNRKYKPDETFIYRIAHRYFPMAHSYQEERFFITKPHFLITPLFLVLLVVESTDLIFALDSIPACLGVSKDWFVIFTSNMFAVIGLRSLYFLISGLMKLFTYLKLALSAILIFIGMKMILSEAVKDGILAESCKFLDISTPASLVIIGMILFLAIIISLITPKIQNCFWKYLDKIIKYLWRKSDGT